MTPRAAFLCLLGASPAWLLFLHAAILRASRAFGRGASPQGAAFQAVFLGAPLAAAGAWTAYLSRLSGAALTGAAIYGLIVYACLSYFYFHLFNLGETSRRLRILIELYRGPVRAEDLERRYPPLSQVDVRLERLLGMGQIEFGEGRYRLKSRRLWLVAACVEAWRRALGFAR